jgi:hypothetical protein
LAEHVGYRTELVSEVEKVAEPLFRFRARDVDGHLDTLEAWSDRAIDTQEPAQVEFTLDLDFDRLDLESELLS